jgi:hypothetical protein
MEKTNIKLGSQVNGEARPNKNGQKVHINGHRPKVDAGNRPGQRDAQFLDIATHNWLALPEISEDDYTNITFKIKTNYHQKLRALALVEMKRLHEVLNEALGKFIDDKVKVAPTNKKR